MRLNAIEEDTQVQSLWRVLRSPYFKSMAQNIIQVRVPFGLTIANCEHVRTAHYAAFKVTTNDGFHWLVRIGVVSETDESPVDNTAYLGTSSYSPSGQLRESVLSRGYRNAGGKVLASFEYNRFENFDVMWTPFVDGTNTNITAAQWHRSLTSLYNYQPDAELPVFTNRAKTMKRLDELEDSAELRTLRTDYDESLEELFEVAGSWSVVHGDAHAGNGLVIDGELFLFDFDTVCWAPSVWDLTHLINRAGDQDNSGYTADELTGLFQFSKEEIAAALKLRKIASTTARLHNTQLRLAKG